MDRPWAALGLTLPRQEDAPGLAPHSHGGPHPTSCPFAWNAFPIPVTSHLRHTPSLKLYLTSHPPSELTSEFLGWGGSYHGPHIPTSSLLSKSSHQGRQTCQGWGPDPPRELTKMHFHSSAHQG